MENLEMREEIITELKKLREIKKLKKLSIKEIKEIMTEILKVLKILKIVKIKIERIKEILGEFEMKMLKNKKKALEKKARKSMIKIEETKRKLDEEEKMTILKTRMIIRAEL